MLLVNQTAILGDIVPNVYIKKITLETSGDENLDRNPHIDHEREPDVIKDVATGKLIRRVLMPDYFKTSKDSEALVVNIDLMMKEKLGDGLVSTWFSQQEFLSYLKVKILQIDGKSELAELLISSVDDNKSKKWKTISVKDEIGKTQLNQLTFAVDSNGDKIYDVSFRVRFVIKNSNPEYLAFMAVPYLDVEALVAKYKLEISKEERKNFYGKPAAEVVIADYSVVGKSYIFIDSGGALWTGPVYLSQREAWYAGFDDTGSPLELREVINSKVQDMRNVKNLEKLQFDFSILENRLFSIGRNLKLLTNDILGVEKNRKNAGSFVLSRDYSGNCRFLFGVNYLQLVKDNVLFGKLFRSDNVELLQYIRLRQATVKRIRVSPDHAGIPDEEGIMWFDRQESLESVASSGEKEPDKFISSDISTGVLREIKLDIGDSGFRFFTGVDKTMSGVTYGLYKYEVELEVEDNTKDFLLERMDNLLASINVLNRYLLEATLPKNFDVALNRFKDGFISAQEKLYSQDEDSAPWSFAVVTYAEVMSVLFEPFQDSLVDFLYSICHPRTGNAVGVQKMIDLIEKLIQELTAVLKITVSGKVNKWKPGQKENTPAFSYIPTTSYSRGRMPNKAFSVKFYSKEFFDSDIPKDVGYDFMTTGDYSSENNEDGLAVISNIEFQKRVEKETLKYFKELTTDINITSDVKTYTMDDTLDNSMYGYLSPAKAQVGIARKLDMLESGAQIKSGEKYKEALSNIGAFTMLKNSPQVPLGKFQTSQVSSLSTQEQVSVSNFTSVLSEAGVSFEPAPVSSSSKSFGSEPDEKALASKILGDTSKSLLEDKLVEQPEKLSAATDKTRMLSSAAAAVLDELAKPVFTGKTNEPLKLTKQEEEKRAEQGSSNVFNLKDPNNGLDKYVATQNSIVSAVNEGKVAPKKEETTKGNVSQLSFEAQNAVKQLPNQLKSVLLSGVSSGKVIKSIFETDGVDSLKDPGNSAEFKMNYNLINRVDVLTGFKKTEDGAVLINEPVWKTLSKELFETIAVGKNILCRLTPYTNKDLGIETPEALELPIYNKYFILSPEKKILDVPIFKVPTTKEEKMKERVKIVKDEQNIFDTEYSSNLIITSNFEKKPAPKEERMPERKTVVKDEEKVVGKDDVGAFTKNVAKEESMASPGQIAPAPKTVAEKPASALNQSYAIFTVGK